MERVRNVQATASDAFGGEPAIILTGQIQFADTGDVQKPSIDFHGL